MHDFQLSRTADEVNLVFDLLVPGKMRRRARDGASEIRRAAAELDPRYRLVVQVDSDYVA
jgi:hypothetical protein